MKFISWNVNGLRSCMNKGFMEFFAQANADFFCLQEIKMQQDQLFLDLPEYNIYCNSANKKGYSGTMIMSKKTPINILYDEVMPEVHAGEGRLITLEFEDFYLVNCYTPNSKRELLRLDYRMQWEDDLKEYLKNLDQVKPVVFCGDLNVAHKEIDLKNPKSNRRNAGFTNEERDKFGRLLDSGFVDSYRYIYPDRTGVYTWWSYMYNARKNNAGWRIDYFVVSQRLKSNIKDVIIHQEVFGSDHCPVELLLEI